MLILNSYRCDTLKIVKNVSGFRTYVHKKAHSFIIGHLCLAT